MRDLDIIENFDKLPREMGVRLPVTVTVTQSSPATVWRLAAAGKLKTVKVSSRVTLFNVGSIRDLLAGSAA